MGEIADMILSGLLDEETGELIDGDEPGFPRRMSDPNMYASGGAYRTPEQQAARAAKNRRKRARKKASKAALAASLVTP